MRPFMRWILAVALLPNTLSAAILPVAEEGGAAPSLVPRPNDRPVPYLVVTDRHLQGAFMPLVQARTRGGLRAAIVTLETIENDYPGGVDLAERIRMFLKDARANWGTQWVLLGGDASVVPVRRARLRVGGLGDIDVATDQYYACLGGSWNADGDGLWGESPGPGEPGDDVDMTPELFVGRAPVRTAAEAGGFVRRTLDYEARLESARPRSALLAAEVINGLVDGAQSAEALRPALEADPDRRIDRLYENPAPWPGSLQESRPALLESLAGGFDLAVLIGAGGPGVIVAGNDYTDHVTGDDLLGLTNAPLYPFVYALSAFTTDPDAALSIGAALMHARRGGAAAVIGTSHLQLVGLAEQFMFRFFDEALGAAAARIGEAQAHAIIASHALFQNDFQRLTTQGNVLFGDPALRLDPRGASIALRRPGRPVFPARVEAAGSGSEPAAAVGGVARNTAVADGASRLEDLSLAMTGIERQPSRVATPAAARAPRPGQVEPARARLETPSPSPARSATALRFVLPGNANGARYELAIFDLLGRRVRALSEGTATPGRFEIQWDLRSDAGAPVADGVYLVRLSLGGTFLAHRLLVLR